MDWRILTICSAPITYAVQGAALLFAVEMAPENGTLIGSLVAGFAGMLCLQTWIIKYLVTDFRKSLDANTKQIQALRQRQTMRDDSTNGDSTNGQ